MRIISGAFRGQRLLPPVGDTTRPITDRVKESLFSIITPWLPGATVADLFCGTGSLGLEALSRGAAHCWFADRDRDAITRLKRNIGAVAVGDQSTVWTGDIVARLADWLADAEAMDIVFLDPPYPMARQWVEDVVAGDRATTAVFTPIAAAVADDGIVMLRTPRDLDPGDALGPLARQRRKEYGSMALNFYGRATGDD